jgi:hypothetical protein
VLNDLAGWPGEYDFAAAQQGDVHLHFRGGNRPYDRQALRKFLAAWKAGEFRVADEDGHTVPPGRNWTFVPGADDPDAGTLEVVTGDPPIRKSYRNPRLVVPAPERPIVVPVVRERRKTDKEKAIETVWHRNGDPAGRPGGVYAFQQDAQKELGATISHTTIKRYLKRLREQKAQKG